MRSVPPLHPDQKADEFDILLRRLEPAVLVTASGFETPARQVARTLGIAVVELTAKADGEVGIFEVDWSALEGVTGAERGGFAEPDDIALVLHTSGSTTLPKIVPLCHRNVCTSAHNVAHSLGLSRSDRCLNMMPLYHVGGLVDLLLAPLSVGGSVVMTTDLSATAFFECLDCEQPTWYQGVPTMLRDIVESAKREGREPGGSTLRLTRAVSAPLHEATCEQFEAWFEVPVIEIYGMTETAGLITSNPLPPRHRKPGSVGLPAGPEVSIVDQEGNPARAKVCGEVIVRGESVMAGYEADGQDPEAVFIGDWLRTGDEGYFDEEGYLHLTGRIKEIINRGGEKISPREIDDLALMHPAILEAATFPIEHASLGEEVAIAVRLRQEVSRSDDTPDERTLIDWFSERLAYFKVPRAVFFVDEFPRTVGGKLKRHALSENYGNASAVVERAPFVAPETAVAQSLAALWERALGVAPIGMNDNFFDLGGDSLKAAAFMRELLGDDDVSLPISALFDAQTLAAFAQVLEHSGRTSLSGDAETSLPTGLPISLHREIGAYLTAWRGKRATTNSLIVGRNTLGSKQPLYWSCNAFRTFSGLAELLGSEQPVYGMRTLRKMTQNTPENVSMLAQHYAQEIMELQPEGPFLLGGFCTGGDIAFEVAERLRAAGREITLLCLQESFVARPSPDRIALFYCSREFAKRHSPYFSYLRPERGWSKLYTGGVSVRAFDWLHREFHNETNFEVFARALASEIESAASGNSPSPHAVENLETGLQVLPEQAYRSIVSARPPRFLAPGQECSIPVRIKNTSSVTWLPTESSG
ncbi:MAG: AMP-binding protein, partial [bacterium]|nr:AMP-binding protein [bacterium]